MKVKTDSEELQSYLTDASNLQGGYAAKLYICETAEEIADILKRANKEKQAVSVSGARTGTVAGAIPFGGYLTLNRTSSE